jgi:hypothetical protein
MILKGFVEEAAREITTQDVIELIMTAVIIAIDMGVMSVGIGVDQEMRGALGSIMTKMTGENVTENHARETKELRTTFVIVHQGTIVAHQNDPRLKMNSLSWNRKQERNVLNWK